jgi:MFS transporter, MHS family, proline/betaine transporter
MQGTSADRRFGGYRKPVVAAGIATFIELYDVVVYGYFATVLAEQFFPQGDPTAALLATFAIFAVGFFVRPIGAIIFGHIGDRAGRRAALATSLLLITFASVALGLLPTYNNVGLLAPVLLLLCRLLQGLSASALPGATLLILEHAPHGWRGRAVSINNAAAYLASAAAATLGLLLARQLSPEQMASWGWRVAFLIAAPIGLVGLFVLTRLLDTPAFVALGELAKQGSAPLTRALHTAKRAMLVYVVWTAATSLGSYMVVGYLPSYLIRIARLGPADAYAASLVAVSTLAASTLLGGYLADKYPLRRVTTIAIAGLAITAVPGFLIINEYHNLGAALVGQTMWAVFLGAAYTAGTILPLILFPVAIRFTAAAVSASVAATLFGGTAPYLSTWLVATTESPIAPGIYLLVAAVAAMLAITFGLPHRPVSEAGDDDATQPRPDRARP